MTREPIYAALFARLAAIPGLKTSSRILKHWNDVPAEQQPALFQAQTGETPQQQTGEPTKWLLEVDLYLYVRRNAGVPGAALNPLIDAIEATFPLHPVTGLHMLDVPGQLGIEWARISGRIETDEGTLGDQAVAIVPVQILAT
jgi:hypothetical protein